MTTSFVFGGLQLGGLQGVVMLLQFLLVVHAYVVVRAVGQPPGMLCPSTVTPNSTFIKGPPFATLTGVNATPNQCRAECCVTRNCTEWIHTTNWTGPNNKDKCITAEPCCQLHSGPSHHQNQHHSVAITSGYSVPWKLQLSGVFTDNMVLQRAPSSAALYGLAPPAEMVHVSMELNSGAPMATPGLHLTRTALSSRQGHWLVRLPPAEAGGNYTVTVTCPTCQNAPAPATMTNITYGDVWICSGQSNAWLPLHHTFGLNDTLRNIRAGDLNGPHGPRIRMFTMPQQSPPDPVYVVAPSHTGGKGMSGALNVWNAPSDAQPPTFLYGNCDVNVYAPYCFSAMCWNFGVGLLNKTDPDVPLGLLSSNVGGTVIQSWSERTQLLRTCGNVSAPGQNTSFFGGLYNGMIAPLVNMSVKGFVWYQGENNIGRLPDGSSSNATGYASDSHLDLSRAPYVLCGVKCVDLVSLAPFPGMRSNQPGAELAVHLLGRSPRHITNRSLW